ncbi:LINE-1 type transposase domain-containing protein 1 [Acipenser ruthenus]|uniref:LINE-1 type transposase domain-containing protein 1 n=1 Tax=Acipenser ruthenus TaxID=7906 RepID=A0A444U0J6_ACIRT|nr:LINE-1 type transposase domain-containing protein 1 [Acipenser ruthenus]
MLEACVKKNHQLLEHQFAWLEEMVLRTVTKLSSIQQGFANFTLELKDVKTELSSVRSVVDDSFKALSLCDSRMDHLESKTAELEDRNRRCNLRLVGLEEGAKGTDVITFLTQSLPLWFLTLAGKNIEIMRAHRAYADSSRPKDKPYTLIFNLLRYTDRQLVLQATRKTPSCSMNKVLRFYPDYCGLTAKRRRAFSQPLSLAHSQGMQAFLLYPAVEYKGDPCLFRSAHEALDFLVSLGIADFPECKDPSGRPFSSQGEEMETAELTKEPACRCLDTK